MDQLIDHPFLIKDEAAQDFTLPLSTPELTGEHGLANGLATSASTGISKNHWHLIFDTIACGVVLINSDKQIVEANRAAQEILGVSFEAMQQYIFTPGNTAFRRPDGTPLPHTELQTASVFRTGEAQHNVLQGFVRPDGQLRWIQTDAAPVREAGGIISRT